MKTLAHIIILLLLGFANAFSQNSAREVFPEQVSIDHNEAVRGFSGDYVTMNPAAVRPGDDVAESRENTAIITMRGMENMVMLEQTGSLNRSIVSVTGANNEIKYSQDGFANTQSINIAGDQNFITGWQEGNYNHIGLNYSGSGVEQRFQQNGMNQSIEFNGVGIPISVSQSGDGARVIIENR